MKKTLCILLTLMIAPCIIFTVVAWGFWGHQRINRMAVFTLPPEMIGFYKKHIDFLTEHAVDPDKRRYSDPEEAARHYIDLDRYGNHPLDTLPKYWKAAIEKYGEDSLKLHGIVVYHIPFMLYRLTNAFKEHNIERILRISAELGHYVGDANVPLHVTKNYNGQLTNQNGIHGLWESRIPELFGDDYDYFVGRCNYIAKPVDYTWNIIRESYAAHDSVLQFEKELTEKYSPDRKYSYEEKGNTIIRVYSKEFSADYQQMMNGMEERRMRSSIIAVSSFWYTAWVNAGMPQLDSLTEFVPSDTLKNELTKMEKVYEEKKGNGKVREE